MRAPEPVAPLAHLNGDPPPAPEWFRTAMAVEPERLQVAVEGTDLEVLAWGERGRPGLVLLHGAGAHAGWWRALAPLLAEDFRVVAYSLSGMGGSGWRPRYDFDLYARELLAVAEAAGLMDTAEMPLVAAHSFGGRVALRAAAAHGERLRAAVIIDSILRPPGAPRMGKGLWDARPTRVYPTLAAGLARFRLAPPQRCENLYILDAIARGSLGPPPGGGEGWTWRFDPHLWENLEEGPTATADLLVARCPTAMIFGARSRIMQPEQVADLRRLAPAVPIAVVPEAEHHVMLDQPLALVAALRALFAVWPVALTARAR